MNFLAQLLSAEVMRLIALSLLHFLWQGTALAAVAYAGMLVCRTAQTRYVLGVAMIGLMATVPVATYFTLRSVQPAILTSTASVDGKVSQAVAQVMVSAKAGASISQPQQNAMNYSFWLVELWFVGVVIFSVRSAGGVLLVAQLRRSESKHVGDELLALCLRLKRKLGLQQSVLFCECSRLDAPAVVGWFRPTILVPITAFTGLSEEQLSSIIAHELAHIKRYDSFVNLFQVVVETLLFYHPAVWWLNKRVREERENCCDDMAVSACGNPLAYAYALARMAGSSTSPRWLLAANSYPLAARVARLLGVSIQTEAVRRADLSLGILCISASLLAGGSFFGAARNVRAQQQPQNPTSLTIPAPAVPRKVSIPVAPAPVAPAPATPASPTPLPAAKPIPDPMPPLPAIPAAMPIPMSGSISARHLQSSGDKSSSQMPASSYIDALKAVGLDNLTFDELIALKTQGVTPEYVKDMRDLGLKVDADQLVGLKIQGISPEYVRTMREATGQPLDSDQLIGLKIQGVTPEFVKQMQNLGIKADADGMIGLKIQGVTAQYIQEMRKLDLKMDTDDLIGMKIQGVTAEYVQRIRDLGLHPDADELIGLKVQGVDADYLKKLQAAGFKLDVEDAIAAKVMGITPEFIEEVRSHGFKDLSLDQLIHLKQSGVLRSDKP